MSNTRILLFFGIIISGVTAFFSMFTLAQAGDRSISIPQVSQNAMNPNDIGDAEKRELLEHELLRDVVQTQDYQASVVNDPRYTDFGRANAVREGNATSIPNGQVTQKNTDEEEANMDDEEGVKSPEDMGGNTVIINQQGGSNVSHITQFGSKNVAVQRQEGARNSLYIEQIGEHNISEEEQIGDDNSKIKIQRRN